MADGESSMTDARRRAEQAYLDCLFEPQTLTLPADMPAEPPTAEAVSPAGGGNGPGEPGRTPAAKPASTGPDTGNVFTGQLIGVAGLKLVLPLSAFTEVLPCPDDIDISHDGRLLLSARLRHGDRDFDLVNLRSLVLPVQHTVTGPLPPREQAAVLLLLDGHTGLVCDQVGEWIQVHTDRLHWREPHSTRTWLAATASLDGYALLDVDGIRQLLKTS